MPHHGIEMRRRMNIANGGMASLYHRHYLLTIQARRSVAALPDVAALFGVACGEGPRLEVCGVEDWECGDSLLLELDPTFQTIEGEH